MNSLVRKIIVVFGMALMPAIVFAQGQLPPQCQRPEMADGLYQSGKIYVVVIVLAIIFVGIAGYLIAIDRKISRLEKEMQNK